MVANDRAAERHTSARTLGFLLSVLYFLIIKFVQILARTVPRGGLIL